MPNKSQKLNRKQREYLQHRQEIRESALDLFSKKGLHKVSMKDIAEASEFAVGTLYNFFKNKNELYHDLVMNKASKFHTALINAIETPRTVTEKIESWISEKIRIFNDDRKFMRIYFTETMGPGSNVRLGLVDEIQLKYDDIINRLTDVFKNGIEQNIFIKSDPYLLALALDGMANAFLFEIVKNGDARKIDAETILNIFYYQVKI